MGSGEKQCTFHYKISQWNWKRSNSPKSCREKQRPELHLNFAFSVFTVSLFPTVWWESADESVIVSEMKVKVLVAQSCLTLCDPMDCSSPGFSIYGIFQARILEWVVIPFSRGSAQHRNQTQVSCITGEFLPSWATREAPKCSKLELKKILYVKHSTWQVVIIH